MNFDFNSLFNSLIETVISGSMLMMVLFLGILLFILILSLILIISYVKALKKAGVSAVNVLWLFLPIPFIPSIILALKLDPVKKFGKGSGYLVGLILLPIIFVPLLAFSDKDVDTSSSDNTIDSNNALNNNVQAEPQNIDNKTFENVQTVEEVQNLVESSSAPVENMLIDTMSFENGSAGLTNNVDLDKTQNIVEPISNSIENVVIDNENDENVPESIPVFESENNYSSNIEPQIVTEEKIIEPQDVVIQEQEVSEIPNAFSSIPENNVVEENEHINTVENKLDEEVISNLNVETSNAKICKNCGTEMPNIVSICPTCGTDNE